VGRIYAIMLNTFREAVRDRVLYAVLGFACAVLLFTLAIAELSLHDKLRVVSDVGLASISLFSVVIAVFLGSSLLYKEIERKTLYVILPKPIARAEFLLGKYLGIVLTAVVFVALMGSLQLWTTSLQAEASPLWAGLTLLGLALALALGLWLARDRTAVLLPFAALALAVTALFADRSGVDLQAMLAQLSLSAVEVMVLASVAILFSSFSTPFLTGIFTLGIWVLGRSADDMATIKSKQLGELTKQVLHAAAEVVPNLQLYVPGRTLLYSETQVWVWPYVAGCLGYGLLYAVVLLTAAAFIFQRRDFV
jgi:Cu-processing system permease protein